MELDDRELKRLKELVPYKILSPTPDEICEEIERLNKELEFEKLKNKEVREYIEDNKEYTLIEKSSNQDFKGIPTFYYTNEDILNQEMIEKVLEILDKGE